MKIIHIISNLGNGGAERLVVDLSEAQADMGHNVSIISFKEPDVDLYLGQFGKVNLKSFSKKKGFSFSLIFSLYRFLSSEKPDVVNCHLPSVFFYIILSLWLLKRTMFFYTIHNNPKQEEPRTYIRSLRKYFINRKRLIPVAISEQIGLNFEKLYALDDVIVINNGRKPLKKTNDFEYVHAAIEKLKIDNATRVFITVARITEQKNQKLLLETFTRLEDRKENCILLVLGDDYGTGLLDQYMKIKADNTFFLGPRKNVADYLYCSDVFCLSSLYEGLPISIIEAINVGLPVISTNVGGVGDIIEDGENGFLVNSLQTDDYVKVVLDFLNLNKKEIQRISENNKHLFYESFSIENTAKEYIDAYKKYTAG